MKTSLLSTAVFSFLLSIVLIGCNAGEKDERQIFYNDAIAKNHISTSKILIIPREGCGGCISGVTYYVVKNYDKLDADLTVVFTGVGDLKLLKEQVGEAFIDKPNVIIDTSGYFQAPKIVSNYPTLVRLDLKKEMRSVVNFSTDDNKLVDAILIK